MKQYIRKICIFAIIVNGSINSFIPMNGQSYIKTETFLNNTATRKVSNLQYYDGLGRKNLSASNDVNTNGIFVYELTEYDLKDRVSHEWLPAIGNSSVNYIIGNAYHTLSSSCHNNEIYPYKQNTYDDLDRQISEIGAGQAWHAANKKVTKRYDTNVAGDIKWYKATSSNNSLVCNTFYPAGTLTMEETVTEDSCIIQVYKDFLDEIVLERQVSADTLLDTYYVYNELNQLSYVLTPEYQRSGYKELYAYEYRYDSYGRLDKKITPQCEPEQYFYDTMGRVIYQQDATGQHYMFFYDNCNRLVLKGTCYNFNYHHYQDVYMQEGEDGLFGTGYVFPELWTLNSGALQEAIFYDDYNFLTKSKFTSSPYCNALSKMNPVNALGLETGRIIRTSDNQYLLIAMYYDNLGRLIDKRETLLDGGIKTTQISYSFTDKPISETCSITMNGTTSTITKSYVYYNTNDQLKSLSISYNGGTPIKVAEYDYNNWGFLSTLHHGGNAGDVSYEYNLRGWTTIINSSEFKEWLIYTDGPGIPYYSGNISSQLWKVDGESFTRGYKYNYDKFNRMTKASYGEGDNLATNTDRYTEWIKEYTLSNAIRKLERYGKKSNNVYGKIDNLRYYYNGLQVDSIKEDAAPVTYAGAFDFVSKTVTTNGMQYCYDSDGALKWDANKGLSKITYDKNRYPRRIQFSNGNVTEYVYTANGEKLKAVYRTAVPNIFVPLGSELSLSSSNTLSVDDITYSGNFIFENGLFSKYLFPEGYITFTSNQPVFHYYTRDHLGNNRAVVNHNGTVEQITHYYPFGAIYSDAGFNDATQHYKYNGKELDRMHGLNFYDYGARQYDPLLGMFTQMDPLAEKYYGISPYAYCANNPVMLVDPDGNSPLSALIKVTAKQGVKAGIKTYVKNNIEHRLKNYMSDKMLKQFAKDVDDVMGTLDNSWWETALELVPVAGDIYGSTKFVKQVKKAYDKLQDLENKYVGKIYDALPKTERKKFVQNMRRKGVADARIDQAKGLDVGGEVKYKKGAKIDGHHTKKVSKNHDKMTDPRTIEFMEQSDHIKYHQQNGY